jgi:AraC-like DNA-binding protein
MLESDRAAVLAYEQHILSTEGPYHVGGRYYADAWDADRQRRWAAERMVRETARREPHASRDAAAVQVNRPSVGTWLTARERTKVDVATAAQLRLTHRDTPHALRGDLTTGHVDAAVVSVTLIRTADVPLLAAIVRDFPASRLVGLVADADEAQALAGTLALGRAGASAVIDVREAAGWSTLRSAFDTRYLPNEFIRRAVAELARVSNDDEAGCTAGWRRFLAAAFSQHTRNVNQVAHELEAVTSTLTSRFWRAGLPSPKRYVAFARLVWAAHLGETPGLSVSAISMRLDASSPQSFGRTVRKVTGMTASEFLHSHDGDAMLARFRTLLIDPYRGVLRSFDPLSECRADRVARAGCGHSTKGGEFSVAGRAA